MDTGERIRGKQNICAIELDATGTALPTPVNSLQPFNNTLVENAQSRKIYFGKASVRYTQVAEQGRAGLKYVSTLKLRFPNGDFMSSERILNYINAKWIYIKLTNGSYLHFGRNDYYQNARPKVVIRNTQNISEISYVSESIFPLGLTNGPQDINITEPLPLNLYNL